MNKTIPGLSLAAAAALAAASVRAEYQDQLIKDGDRVAIIGDSITDQGFTRPWGYCRLLQKAMPKVEFIPLGFSGYRVEDWLRMERETAEGARRGTPYKNPGWDVGETLDSHPDVLVVFLGMNDILQPTVTDDPASAMQWFLKYDTLVRNLEKRVRPRQVVLASITPLTTDETSPKNRMRLRMNNAIKARDDVAYADFGEVLDDALKEISLVDSGYRLIPDFVHPGKLGHMLIAKSLLDACGCEEESGKVGAEIDESVSAIAAGAPDVCASVECLRVNRPGDREFFYSIMYSVKSDSSVDPEVSMVLPEGWTCDEKSIVGGLGEFTIRGAPSKLRNRIVVDAGAAGRKAIDIPAPWKVSDGSGEWKVYSASPDYTGGDAPGSIDPFQLYVGKRENTVFCRRRVKSAKARQALAVFSHQTFSATLDLKLVLNGESVFEASLDRHGKNRAEKTVALREGWNDIEIECRNREWQRQFSFDLLPADGDSLDDLEFSLE